MLDLFYPVAQVGFQSQPPQQEAPHHTQQDSAHDIDDGNAHPEGAEKHGHGHLVDQRRGDEVGKGDSQRYASFDKPDEKGNRRAGAEGSNGSEEGGKEVLQSVEPVCGEVVAQPLEGEIGVDDAHDGADDEEQQHNFYRVVDKKVKGAAERCVGT